MQFAKVFLSAYAAGLFAIFGDLWCIFLHHLCFDEKEEAHEGRLTRRR